jgi:hypothetical protein
MFQFAGLPLPGLCIQPGVTEHYLGRVSPFGDPWINARSGSPRHFVACHVLHRLLAPRHPPRALCSLTSLSNLPNGMCGGMIGVHYLVISRRNRSSSTLLPITSSLVKVRPPLRAAHLIGGPGAQRSAGRWPRTRRFEDTDQGTERGVWGLRCRTRRGAARGLVETRRLELLTLSLQRRCSSS